MNSQDDLDQSRQPSAQAKRASFNHDLRQELLDMAAKDQEVRKTLGRRYKPGERMSPEDGQWAIGVDAAHTARMRAIIAQFGWPGRSLVGEDGAHTAWLLVQHADRDRGFQERCLELLAQAVARSEASAQDMAYLTDRVRVHARRPQVYGTQLRLENDRLTAGLIEDEANVDARRAEVGLGPLADYIEMCSRRME